MTSRTKTTNRRSQWFRLYAEIIESPKVQRLSGDVFRTWINCLCVASRRQGQLPSIPDLAFLLRQSEKTTHEHVDALIDAGLVDYVGMDPSQGRQIHDWHEHQYQYDLSTNRVRKHRSRKTMKHDETFHETNETIVKRSGETVSCSESESKTPVGSNKRERFGTKGVARKGNGSTSTKRHRTLKTEGVA